MFSLHNYNIALTAGHSMFSLHNYNIPLSAGHMFSLHNYNIPLCAGSQSAVRGHEGSPGERAAERHRGPDSTRPGTGLS